MTARMKRFKEPKVISEEDIARLFKSNKVLRVVSINRIKELTHTYEANVATKNLFYKLCTKHKFAQLRDNPICILTITDDKLKARNRYSDELIIPKQYVDKYNTNLPVEEYEEELKYNLFELPDFDKPGLDYLKAIK